jgi:D-arabinan exo alpha-(1,3)/(1,5)-arabinofuranosidase (non-reducing end)
MKKIIFISLFLIIGGVLFPQTTNLKSLYKLSNAKTRSISPENITGEKGRGGMATLEEGSAAEAARKLGQGWKVNPYIHIQPGETFTLGEINESGVINHIWMTPVGNYRLMILRFYWDDESEPSIEVPVGDFFASGWGIMNEPVINSATIAVNPRSGFNSYWQMPFGKKCRITMENKADEKATVYYQINYSLENIEENTPYFHAQFRRVNKLQFKEVYTIVDEITGKGQYVGTYLAHGARKSGWWGEGEVKFFMDGDKEFPTICTTGEEDYFLGSYGYNDRKIDGKMLYDSFTSLYSGFFEVKNSDIDGYIGIFGQYRWHVLDPIRFDKDLRITVQSLGWGPDGYLPLEDDLASVAYWYQIEPHNQFPTLPSNDKLIIKQKRKQ